MSVIERFNLKVGDFQLLESSVEKHGTHDQKTHAGSRGRSGTDTDQTQTKKPVGEQEVTDPNAPKPDLKPGRKPDGSGTVEERMEKLVNGERIEVTANEIRKVIDIMSKRSDNPDMTNMHIKNTELYDEDNLGIPRNQMPQVPSDAKKEFVLAMEQRGAKATRGVADPKKLHPIQAEISASKASKIALSLEKRGIGSSDESRIIISKDNYVIDGHHRWAAVSLMSFSSPDVRLPVIKIDMNHKDLIDATSAWNEATGIQSIGMGENNPRGQLQKWAEFDAIVAKAVRKRTVIKFQLGLKPILKHADHDQSSHGNWAGTRSPNDALSAERAKQVAAYKNFGLSTDDLLNIFENGNHFDYLEEIAVTYGITTNSGHEFRISDVDVYRNQMKVYGEIVDFNGEYAGEFIRGIEYDSNSNKFTAYHGLLDLVDSAQGEGIGSEFFRHNENYYLSKGFEAIKLEAALSVGPYAWAKQGFKFDDATAEGFGYDNRGAYENHLEDFKRMNALSEPAIAKINNLQVRLRSDDPKIRNSVQPIDIAMLSDGERNLGKEIMTSRALGDIRGYLVPPRYYAIKYLTPDGMPGS